MGRRQLVSSIPVNEYLVVHPALDFWGDNAIIAVGGKWLDTYSDGDVDFATKPLCILSGGEKFQYSKKELAARQLFHTGHLDIPACRWDYGDIDSFGNNASSCSVATVYQEIRDAFKYYMDFINPRLYSVFSCFVIYTYFYPLFNNAPILQLWGEFKTGKTKLLALLEATVFNPVNSANISSASVFRLIESRRATVLLDESEDLTGTDKGKEIRNMLLAGTGRTGETFRQEKDISDRFHTQSYKIFSPKVIANIAGIDIPALQSRVIRIATIGAADKQKESREVEQEDPKWQAIRNKLYRLCLCKHTDVVASKESIPVHKFTGRTLGIWLGIFAIANLVGKSVWEDVCSFAQENKEFLDSETESESDRPKQMLAKLIELAKTEKHSLFSPDEVMLFLSSDINFTSKRDLGLRMGRLGLYTRVLSRNGCGGRFYELYLEKLLALYEHR